MKRIILTFFLISLISCNNNYEKEEFKALEDITNNYLLKNHLNKMREKSQIFSENEIEEIYEKPLNIDTLDLKVYLSDALLPISQVKEDNEWMFDDNYFGTKDSTIFHSIVNSRDFENLKYREFEKSKIQFIKPYRQFEKSNEKLKENEDENAVKTFKTSYTKFQWHENPKSPYFFSQICAEQLPKSTQASDQQVTNINPKNRYFFIATSCNEYKFLFHQKLITLKLVILSCYFIYIIVVTNVNLPLIIY